MNLEELQACNLSMEIAKRVWSIVNKMNRQQK